MSCCSCSRAWRCSMRSFLWPAPLARSRTGRVAPWCCSGGLACACVIYRMIVPPTPAGGIVSLSLREGPWLALLGSMMMVLGGVWPRTFSLSSSSSEGGVDLWSGLSGWTPES